MSTKSKQPCETISQKTRNSRCSIFDIRSKVAAPAGYSVPGRERGEIGGQIDAAYKVRGLEPGSPEMRKWKCPFAAPSKSRGEVDISFLGANQVKRAFSPSCTAEPHPGGEFARGLLGRREGMR